MERKRKDKPGCLIRLIMIILIIIILVLGFKLLRYCLEVRVLGADKFLESLLQFFE